MKVEVECLCKDCDYCEIDYWNDSNYCYRCYYWDYEEGMSPNSVDPNGFCNNAKIRKRDD